MAAGSCCSTAVRAMSRIVDGAAKKSVTRARLTTVVRVESALATTVPATATSKKMTMESGAAAGLGRLLPPCSPASSWMYGSRAPHPSAQWRSFTSQAPSRASHASGGVNTPLQLINAAQEDLEAGVSLMEEGHVQLAMDKFQNSILLNPTALAYYNQGVGYYSQNDVTSAIKAWEKAISMQPDLADAYCNLANAYVSNLKDTKKALDYISTAARLSPGDAEIQFNYGLILDRAGKLEEAVKQYNIAKELGISRADALARNAGARLLAAKQADEASRTGGATKGDGTK